MKKIFLALCLKGALMATQFGAIKDSDPEFFKIYENFSDEISQEVLTGQGALDKKDFYLSNLASILGAGGLKLYDESLDAALKILSAQEIKEMLYQSAAYIGTARVREFFDITNEKFKEKNVNLPLENLATTDKDSRLKAGANAQKEIFGSATIDTLKGEMATLGKWLSANCFGDYYTRNGLNLRQRELITFFFLAAQGGAQPQLIAHAKGNFNMGNDKAYMLKAIEANVGIMGYPKALNAISALNEASKN